MMRGLEVSVCESAAVKSDRLCCIDAQVGVDTQQRNLLQSKPSICADSKIGWIAIYPISRSMQQVLFDKFT